VETYCVAFRDTEPRLLGYRVGDAGICCLAVISHPAKFNRSSVEQLEHTKTLSFVVTSGGVKHAYTTSNTQTVYPSKFNRFGWDSVHIVLQILDFRVSLMAEIELDS